MAKRKRETGKLEALVHASRANLVSLEAHHKTVFLLRFQLMAMSGKLSRKHSFEDTHLGQPTCTHTHTPNLPAERGIGKEKALGCPNQTQRVLSLTLKSWSLPPHHLRWQT